MDMNMKSTYTYKYFALLVPFLLLTTACSDKLDEPALNQRLATELTTRGQRT